MVIHRLHIVALGGPFCRAERLYALDAQRVNILTRLATTVVSILLTAELGRRAGSLHDCGSFLSCAERAVDAARERRTRGAGRPLLESSGGGSTVLNRYSHPLTRLLANGRRRHRRLHAIGRHRTQRPPAPVVSQPPSARQASQRHSGNPAVANLAAPDSGAGSCPCSGNAGGWCADCRGVDARTGARHALSATGRPLARHQHLATHRQDCAVRLCRAAELRSVAR